MPKGIKTLLTASFSLGLAAAVQAQIGGIPAPTVPGGTAPPPTLPTGIAPYPTMPGEPTVWSQLGLSAAQREYRHRQMCRTPGGQLIGKMMNPISVLSGGLISPFCPTTPSLAELQDPGAIGAAAKIKQDRAGAEDRMKAVRYMGTVDCHYWPEAEDALIAALRQDRNECVRYEAAVVLGNGCCCTPKVMMALAAAVSCSQADDNPIEKSARVRSAAAAALEKCMISNCMPCGPAPSNDPLVDPNKDPNKERKTQLDDLSGSKNFYATVSKYPREKVLEICRKALETGAKIGYEVTEEINATDYAAVGLPTGPHAKVSNEPRNLWDAFTRRSTPATIATMPVVPASTMSTTVMTAKTVEPKVAPAIFTAPTPTPATKTLPVIQGEVIKTTPVVTPAPAPVVKPTPVVTPAPVPVVKPTPVVTPAPAPVVKMIPVETPAPVVKPTLVATPAPLPAPVVKAPTMAMPTVVTDPAPVAITPAPVKPMVAPAPAPVKVVVTPAPVVTMPSTPMAPRPMPSTLPPEPTPLATGYELRR